MATGAAISGPRASAWLALLTCAAAAVLTNGVGVLATICRVTLPLAAGLLVVHGVVNPSFPSTVTWFGWFHLRESGLSYAVTLSGRLCIIAAGLLLWRYTKRTHVLAFFQSIGIPTRALCMLAIAGTSLSLFASRGRAVQLAQQARGLDLKATLLARFVALPRLVVPVVTASLIDAEHRGVLMEHRGFGRQGLVLPDRWTATAPATTVSKVLIALLPPIAAVAVRCLQ